MSPDLEKRLSTKYPELFSQVFFGVECGDGWYNIIDRLCGFIQSSIYNLTFSGGGDEGFHLPQLEFSQIKEKYGTLR